jgi:hypothetical protein
LYAVVERNFVLRCCGSLQDRYVISRPNNRKELDSLCDRLHARFGKDGKITFCDDAAIITYQFSASVDVGTFLPNEGTIR